MFERLDIVEHLNLAVVPQREEVLEIPGHRNIAELQYLVILLGIAKEGIVALLVADLNTLELQYLVVLLDIVKAGSLALLLEALDILDFQDIAEHRD